MRNLRNTRHDQWAPPSQFKGKPLTAATWDLANDFVVCAFGPTENDPLIELVRVAAKGDLQYVILIIMLNCINIVIVNIQLSPLGMRHVQIQIWLVTKS